MKIGTFNNIIDNELQAVIEDTKAQRPDFTNTDISNYIRDKDIDIDLAIDCIPNSIDDIIALLTGHHEFLLETQSYYQSSCHGGAMKIISTNIYNYAFDRISKRLIINTRGMTE